MRHLSHDIVVDLVCSITLNNNEAEDVCGQGWTSKNELIDYLKPHTDKSGKAFLETQREN